MQNVVYHAHVTKATQFEARIQHHCMHDCRREMRRVSSILIQARYPENTLELEDLKKGVRDRKKLFWLPNTDLVFLVTKFFENATNFTLLHTILLTRDRSYLPRWTCDKM